LKKIWLHSVRAYIKIGLFFYFKEIKVVGLKNIPKDKPVLFLSNHQNALLDALLIATKNGRFSYFLTRASVFKNPIVSKLLKSLNMLPVYRIRDGWSTITNNNSIFNLCSTLLHQNETIVIFPEGNHNLNRTVRTLSKGFTRIVFDTLEKYPDIDLQLIPVGLNFINAEKFADSAAMYFGNPIKAKDYIFEDRNKSIVKLKEDIHKNIRQLTTNISNSTYDETLQKLVDLNVNFLNPEAVNNCIANGFKDCDNQKRNRFLRLKTVLKGVLILNLVLPYVIWKFLLQPKIKEVEFTATFRFAVAITLVPLYLLIICLVLASVLNLTIGLGYIVFVLILALLTIKL
jgi:1-acyl-sn-glycerol-3-phosphate acyltransferase